MRNSKKKWIHPVLGKLRQEDCQFKASLSYIRRPCLKNRNKKVNFCKKWAH
jgi:hypothetical protein